MHVFRKNKVVIPNSHTNQESNANLEEVEIAAQISIPQDGGWAWMVLFASFFCFFIQDGIVYTYGSVIKSISEEFRMDDSWIALVNSVASGIYMSFAPLASAFINRCGFRICAMIGSTVCCLGYFCSYLATNYATLLIFNGIVTGLGCALINMSAGIVPGFYFEKFRAIAFAITSCGSSFGISLGFPLLSKLTELGGWRPVMLLNSGICGIIFFLGMTFKPLPSVIVTNADLTPDERTRTVTFLPSLTTAGPRLNAASGEPIKATTVQRLLGTRSNYNYPTAAAVIDPNAATVTQAGTAGSTAASTPRIQVSTRGMNQRQVKQIQSMISRPNVQDIVKRADTETSSEADKPQGCCGRLCHWERHPPESRPMYRDDAFYSGTITQLPVYRKSVVEISPENKTGLEYQLAVSRAVAVTDLEEKRGVCTAATKRVLATMMDCEVLKKHSFQLYCFYGFMVYAGYMVPFVFIKDRNALNGVPETHCNYFVSAIAIASAIGRLVLCTLAIKVDPVCISGVCAVIAGVASMMSGMSHSVAYQYGYSVIFGVTSCPVNCLRSLVLVKLYGLEKLTNATGMFYLFLGLGNIISTPLAGMLKNSFGFDVAFYVTGGFSIVAGIAIFIMMIFERIEKNAANAETSPQNAQGQVKKEKSVRISIAPTLTSSKTKR